MVKSRLPLTVIAFALIISACTSSDSEPTTTTGSPPTGAPTATTASSTTQPPQTTTTGPAPTTTTSIPDATYTPVFEEASCEFDEPDGRDPRCGFLVVPEDRDDPGGSQVRIHVAVFPAETDDPAPDPIVYLEGGPGGHALEGLQFSFEDRFAPFLSRSDLVIFDQRGVGFSEPALSCPELRELEIELLDDVLGPEEYTALEIEALRACRDRLTDEGVDLTSYNSQENAADVADLRTVLGYESWNLYGISYGTRLALTVLRDHPEGVRAAVLDSTVPLQTDLVASIPATADRAFDELFASCGALAACAATFPNLESKFFELREILDAQAAEIEVTDFLSGESYPGVLTGDDLVGLTFQSLYSEQLIPVLPDVINDALNGDLNGLQQLASLFFTNDRFLTVGMFLAVQCNEEYPFSSVEAVADAAAAHPEVEALVGDIEGEFRECSVWGSGTANDIEDDPVVSDVPTLVLGGAFDPITPPDFGRVAAETLSNSYFFEFPGLAHGVSTAHECPLAITLAFLDDPATEPDGSCISGIGPTPFLTPGRLSVDLVPFEEDIFGLTVRGVVPDGWDGAGFGQYTAPGLGDTAIVQQARDLDPGLTIDSMAAGIADFFEIPAWDRSSTTVNRTWDLFEGFDGELMILMGLTEDEGRMLMVILAAPIDVFDDYRRLVFLPALEAIRASA